MITEISGLIMKILGVNPYPVKRGALLMKLWKLGYPMNDRELRKTYEHLPICSGHYGLFIPSSKEDVEAYEKYLSKKIPPWKVREKINIIKICHPEWYPNEVQRELFQGKKQ